MREHKLRVRRTEDEITEKLADELKRIDELQTDLEEEGGYKRVEPDTESKIFAVESNREKYGLGKRFLIIYLILVLLMVGAEFLKYQYYLVKHDDMVKQVQEKGYVLESTELTKADKEKWKTLDKDDYEDHQTYLLNNDMDGKNGIIFVYNHEKGELGKYKIKTEVDKSESGIYNDINGLVGVNTGEVGMSKGIIFYRSSNLYHGIYYDVMNKYLEIHGDKKLASSYDLGKLLEETEKYSFQERLLVNMNPMIYIELFLIYYVLFSIVRNYYIARKERVPYVVGMMTATGIEYVDSTGMRELKKNEKRKYINYYNPRTFREGISNVIENKYFYPIALYFALYMSVDYLVLQTTFTLFTTLFKIGYYVIFFISILYLREVSKMYDRYENMEKRLLADSRYDEYYMELKQIIERIEKKAGKN